MTQCIWTVVLLALLTGAARAQAVGTLKPGQTPTVLWSQVDTYVGLTPNMNFMLLASGTPGQDSAHPELVIGPNLDIFLLPFLTPRLITVDPERSKYLNFRLGYHYVKPLYGKERSSNNGVLELTPRLPLAAGFQIADRNRIDLLGLPDRFSWRYRNRLAVARSFPVGNIALTPYGQAEVFYNCERGEWTQYSYRFGVLSRITSQVGFDAWFLRRTSFTDSNVHVNVVGLKLILFFHNVQARNSQTQMPNPAQSR